MTNGTLTGTLTSSGPIAQAWGTSNIASPVPSTDFLVNGFINVAIQRAFASRSETFRSGITEILLKKPYEERCELVLRIFSPHALSSYEGLDDQELLNFLALTL